MWDTSNWEYDTSYEDSTSVAVVTGAGGELFFVNPVTDEHLSFKYSVLSVGATKGAVFNIAKSLVTTPSGGLANVRVRHGFTFEKSRFPCNALIISGGVTAGIFTPSFIDDSGADVAFLGFGADPFLFAWVPIWGRFSSILPSGGVSLGILKAEEATTYKPVPDAINSNVG
jgi:hypothetical protein